MTKEEYEKYQKWCQENLVMAAEGHKITGQSLIGFNQSVTLGKIKPFLEFGEARKTRLYLRSDLEEYAKTKRIR
ncbi:hypothetical protein [Bacillus sp. REN10]|uniref:hypothetical protein n=1 Tax=Bacillus sp. REN10 TaxID=2782541 RepID=UPI00193BAA06|nr:hypothetical protein [Bacillus sp. REN10]